nr:hypothetical protein GCM10025732_33840 [Glycomyces mayteni]
MWRSPERTGTVLTSRSRVSVRWSSSLRGSGEVKVAARSSARPRAATGAAGAVGEAEEVAGGAVAHGDAAVAADEDESFADGVEDRLVVLEHVAQFAGGDAAGLAGEAGADEGAAGDADGEDARGDGGEREEPLVELGGDGVHGDADGHERDDRAVLAEDGDDGAHGGAEGAGVGLGEGASFKGRFGVADEVAADLGGVGVGEADAVAVHDRDEVDVGVGAHALGERLEVAAGERGGEGVGDGGRVGDGGGDGEDLLAGTRVHGSLRVGVGEGGADTDEDAHEDELQRQELPGQGPPFAHDP